jgi:hypothetical protein
VFDRRRALAEKLEKVSAKFPGSMLDLVIPCVREQCLILLETADFSGTNEAESFARKVSYYFRFAKDVADMEKFFQEVCERWSGNCFSRAHRHLVRDTDEISDLPRLLQSRAIAAAAESGKLYRKFELEDEFPDFLVGKLKTFILQCLCQDDTQETQTQISLHKKSEIFYSKIFLATLEDYFEPRQLELYSRDVSDSVKAVLYPRYLKQRASEIAAGVAEVSIEDTLAMVEEPAKNKNGKIKTHPSAEIIQAERLLARRMEIPKNTEWRVVFFRHLIKTAVERRRAGLEVAPTAASLEVAVIKTVQSEHLTTLKAMLEDLKQAEAM